MKVLSCSIRNADIEDLEPYLKRTPANPVILQNFIGLTTSLVLDAGTAKAKKKRKSDLAIERGLCSDIVILDKIGT